MTERSGNWSQLFKWQLAFVSALCLSSAAQLFRYAPGLTRPMQLSLAGLAFIGGGAALIYALLHLRKMQGPMTGRELVILLPLWVLTVGLLVTRTMLMYR